MTVTGRQCNAHKEEKGGGACAHSTKVIFRLSVIVSATNCDTGGAGLPACGLCLQAAEGRRHSVRLMIDFLFAVMTRSGRIKHGRQRLLVVMAAGEPLNSPIKTNEMICSTRLKLKHS